jgi:hypothetical protein
MYSCGDGGKKTLPLQPETANHHFLLDIKFENVVSFTISFPIGKFNIMLTDLLTEKRTSLIDSWLKLIFESYPAATADFLKKEKDRFSNPVAYQFIRGVNGLFQALIQDMEEEKLFANLDEVIKVQAIQQFSPSQALAFIFLLKKVIREHLTKELHDENLAQECREIESKIDGLALLGFDVYMKRREKLYEIRMQEVKASVGGLIRKTGLSMDILEVPTCK